MIAVPFIYFSIFSWTIYKKRGNSLDFAVIITAMYAISGFFSILVDLFDLRLPDATGYQISSEAAIAYCGLITLCVLPFVFNSNIKITSLKPCNNPSLIKIMAILSLLWFLMLIIFGWSIFTKVLGSDMLEARRLVYTYGTESWTTDIPGIIRPIIIILNLVFSCTWILIFLAFYSRYVQRMSKVYFWIFLFASLSGPFLGVMGADRSSTAYWLIAALGMFLLFRPFIKKKEKKQLILVGVIIASILLFYFALMTIARFSERNMGGDVSGVQGSSILYLGQGYIHFCMFYDNYTPPILNLGIIFPFIGRYVFGLETGQTTIQEQMSLMTSYDCGVFKTFLGQIIMGAGKIVAIVFCIAYSLFSFISLPFVAKKRNVQISSIFLYFALVSVLYFGLFVHYYANPYITFSLFFFYFFLRIAR